MSQLSQYRLFRVEDGDLPASAEEIALLHPLVPGWKIEELEGSHHLTNLFQFDRPETCERFVGNVDQLAQAAGREPNISREGEIDVKVVWREPIVGELHPNDFLMAAKTDGIYVLAKQGYVGTMRKDADKQELLLLSDAEAYRPYLRPERFDREVARS